MDPLQAEAFMQDQIPLSARALIAPTLKNAYAAARVLADSDPILSVASAKHNHGRLISWAVDFGFEKLLKSQQWPFDFSWRPFARPTGRYLEIRFSHSVMSISQFENPNKQPRDVVFRENARLHNEPFFNLPEFNDVRVFHGLPHFLLIHGHQDLSFAHLAVPHSLHHRDWIYRTANLLNLPYTVESDLPPTEETEFDVVMELKQEIEKWRKDNGI